MNMPLLRFSALALAVLASACSHRVEDIDPQDPENIDLAFGFDDLLTIANDMTQSFLGSDQWGGDRPRVLFGGIANRTSQHIDTENITDTIRTGLVQSGKFTVLAGSQGLSEINQEVEYQQSGAVDLASAAELGKQLGAEYVFYGRFTEIYKSRSDTSAIWYKFTMNAVNTQTRQIVWSEEQNIAKKEEKSFLGW